MKIFRKVKLRVKIDLKKIIIYKSILNQMQFIR